LQVYFLDNEDYFQRKSVLTDAKDKFHTDNDERAIFFCKGVIETVKKLGWTPDIVHCHGWMTSLIPLYLKTHFAQDPIFGKSKVIYTVYNNGEVDHPLPNNFAEKAKLEGVPQDMMSHYSHETFLGVSRGGIQMADAVTKGQEKLDIRLEDALTECQKTKAVYPFLQEEEKSNIAEHYDKVYHELMG
jgi:starch synthase